MGSRNPITSRESGSRRLHISWTHGEARDTYPCPPWWWTARDGRRYTRRKKVCPYSTPELQPCSPSDHLQPNLRTGIRAHPNLHRPTPPRPLPPERGGGGESGWGGGYWAAHRRINPG